jgi:hypothetical protein
VADTHRAIRARRIARKNGLGINATRITVEVARRTNQRVEKQATVIGVRNGRLVTKATIRMKKAGVLRVQTRRGPAMARLIGLVGISVSRGKETEKKRVRIAKQNGTREVVRKNRRRIREGRVAQRVAARHRLNRGDRGKMRPVRNAVVAAEVLRPVPLLVIRTTSVDEETRVTRKRAMIPRSLVERGERGRQIAQVEGEVLRTIDATSK